MNSLAAPRSWRLPSQTLLIVLMLIATLIRISLTFRVPLLVTGDSEGYIAPAFGLAHGEALQLSIKRTPIYPLFLAFSLITQGDNLASIAILQHLLGLVTVGASYFIAAHLFGRIAGFITGLVVALSGTQLLAEHSLMTESIFIPAFVLTVALMIWMSDSRSLPPIVLAGFMVAITTLIRPVAAVLLPILVLTPLLSSGVSRKSVLHAALAGLVPLIVLAGWSLRPGQSDDASSGGIGQTLVGRTARHDRGAFQYWDPARDSGETPARQQARKILQDAADRGSSGRAVHTRIRKELGLAPGEADALMRDLALATIRSQFSYYVQGTFQRFVRLSAPVIERLRDDRNTNDIARQRWEDEPSRPLIQEATDVYDREAATAESIVGLVQLGRMGATLPLLAIVGLVMLSIQRRATHALILSGAGFAILFVSAALVGNVSRYRYPIDPLMCTLAVGVVALLIQWLASRLIRSPRTSAPSATLSDSAVAQQ